MEESQNTQSVAAQTEVPVSSVPPPSSVSNGRKFNIPKLDKKITIALVVAFVIIVGLSGYLVLRQNNNRGNIELLSAEYTTAYQDGDYKKAEEIAKDELSKDKTNPILNSGVINAISSRGNQAGTEKEALDQAKPYIDQALKSDPDGLAVLLSVGYAHETAGDYEKALDYYKRATELYPNSSEAWFHYGHVLQFLSKNSESKQAYETAYKLDSVNPQVLMVLASQYFMENNFEKAKEFYLNAAQQPAITATNKAEALSAASTAARSMWNINEAVVLGKQAVDADPAFSPALGAYGYALSMSGQNTEGINTLKKAISANPRITRNYYMLGIVYRANKNYNEAINMLNDALGRLDNDNTIIGTGMKNAWRGIYTYQLANTYSFAGINTDQVVPLLRQAIAINPAIKTTLTTDFQNNNYLSAFSSNPEFLALMN